MDKVKSEQPKFKAIGDRIAIARDAYQLSQQQLGANLGVTRAAVSQYEQGKIRPRPEVVDRLAELFNADPEWFERGRGRRPDPLDAPVTIHEISVELLTLEAADAHCLHNGRKWQLPSATFPEVELNQENMVAIVAPNDADPISRGDRVLIDTRRHLGAGVFLVVDTTGPQLRRYAGAARADGALVVGRAVAYLRSL